MGHRVHRLDTRQPIINPRPLARGKEIAFSFPKVEISCWRLGDGLAKMPVSPPLAEICEATCFLGSPDTDIAGGCYITLWARQHTALFLFYSLLPHTLLLHPTCLVLCLCLPFAGFGLSCRHRIRDFPRRPLILPYWEHIAEYPSGRTGLALHISQTSPQRYQAASLRPP